MKVRSFIPNGVPMIPDPWLLSRAFRTALLQLFLQPKNLLMREAIAPVPVGYLVRLVRWVVFGLTCSRYQSDEVD
jgi:hypothetical protein